MKCPACPTVDLIMTERLGVEIDYCPTCRGIWLDRGELDKIIEQSYATRARGSQYREDDDDMEDHDDHDDHRGDHDDHGHGYQGGHRRRRSWLSELFD